MIPAAEKELILEILNKGEIEVEGQFVWGSNYTFLCEVIYQEQGLKAVYKPTRGERPLWDFPNETLAGREAAAYLVSEAGGWQFVPPTVYRQEAPAGPGSLQLFIEHDPEYHYFKFTAEERMRLMPVALFDAIINNTDRKGGHVLVDEQDQFWLIDHGVCFHIQPKLRTVIWDFAGKPILEPDCRQLEQLQRKLMPDNDLHQELLVYLSQREIQAMRQRIEVLLTERVFPEPSENRYSYPWPPV